MGVQNDEESPCTDIPFSNGDVKTYVVDMQDTPWFIKVKADGVPIWLGITEAPSVPMRQLN
jgi:hypothetical protein